MTHIIWVSVSKLFHIFMVSDSDGKKIRKKHSVSVLFGFWTLSIIVKTHT